MATDDRLVKIVKLLLRSTKAGRLEWDSVGSNDRPRYVTSFTDASFVVYSKDNDGAHPFIVELRNERGEILESIQSASIRPLRRELNEEERLERQSQREFNNILYELHNVARRNAMNIDSFLDNLLSQLETQIGDGESG
ncbi:hypothetical protein [Streptomyces cinereoruber]|uniref:hypothetical protein n=1 Tax=Streptomyces cinereoruber TaxID=67260 RepID=UPI00363DD298